MKKLIAVGAVLVIAVAGFFFFNKGTDSTNGGSSSGKDNVSEKFTAKIELQLYSVTIEGSLTRENKDKITVAVESPQEMEDFSVEFDNTNKDDPVKLKFKNLEYNVGKSATPLTDGVAATANLLMLLNENDSDSEIHISDQTFGQVTLTRQDGEIIIKSEDNNLKVRIYDFSQ